MPALSRSARLRVVGAAPLLLALVAVAAGPASGSARAETLTPAGPSDTVRDLAPTPAVESAPVTSGPATLTLAVNARKALPKANVRATTRLRAPNGAPLGGVRVTFWMTPTNRPSVHIAAAHAVTNSRGVAGVRLRMSVSERINATATYATRVLASGATLPAGTVKSRQSAVVWIQVPLATRVLALAAALRGRPYVWGAAGSRSFDCSGYTMYVMAHAAGRSLPHSAAEQYALSRHVSKSAIRPGDLVFFLSGGHAYHVGIYAGHGLMWHAPHTGDHVRLAPIYSSSWAAGRVI